jgi:hypothetical protein
MQVTTDGLASLRRLAAPSREFEGVSHPRVCPGRGRETAVGEPGHWVIRTVAIAGLAARSQDVPARPGG